MAEQDQKDQQEEEDEYDGPWIEKRIEWKCPDRKRHNVVLFGSWNRFKGGDELEYQGKQVFACNVKLPLGTYVYRFLIDAEEWETHNNAPKTARNGIEYNQIHVTEDSDEEEDDEFGGDAGDENENADDEDGGNTTLMMGADGKLTMGKKRRGRPSVELDLGQDFAADAEGDDDDLEAPDENDEAGNDADADTSEANGDTDGAKKGKRKGKKKRNKKKKKKKGDKEQDKEWAKYVFVQQLRLQQQHNDEINRVKTLWKQERQVRVEMHKKVVKQLKETKAKLQEQEVEIERLSKQAKVGKVSDEKLSAQLKVESDKLREEKQKLQKELQVKEKEFTEYRKKRNDEEKKIRESKGDWESKERKLQQEISGYKSQIETMKKTQATLEANLSTVKDGNTKTMELKSLQFAEREQQWKQEKEEFDAAKKEIKKLKSKANKLEKELQDAKDETSAEKKKVSTEKKKCDASNEKIKALEGQIEELKNSSEAADRIKLEVNKVRTEKESENKVLAEKLANTEKQLAEQKGSYEARLKEMEDSNKSEIAALKSNSDAQMNEVIDKLKADISGKNDELSKNQEEITKLQSSLTEEKANNDGLCAKIKGLEDEVKVMKESEEKTKGEYDALKSESGKMEEEYKALQASSSAGSEEAQGKIDKLENEVNSLKAQIEDENKSNEERVGSLEKQVEDLKNSVNEKNESSAKLTQELTDAQQEIEKYKNNESALGSEVSSLKEQIAKEQEILNTKEKEYQENISKIQSDLEQQLSEKDTKLAEVTDSLNAKESELSTKLEEFANAESRIEELKINLNAEKQNLENEKKNNEETLRVYVEKEERIHNSCKSLFSKFNGIREEMKSVQGAHIKQLEELSSSFGQLEELLTKLLTFNQEQITDLLTKYKRELSLRRKYFNMVQDLRGNIRVFCRFRPLLPFELKKNYTECVKFPEPGKVQIVDDKGKTLYFEYDQVYGPKTTQKDVSEDTTEYIQSVMDGYNVSIFAYGQTGSGKTYTMNGPRDNPGVNLRALKHLFKISEERTPQFQYHIKVSIFEIYNENINDLITGAEELLNKKKKKKKNEKPKKKKNEKFKVRHLPDGSVEVPGLTKIQVTSEEDIFKLEAIAQKNRSASATDMNAHSSRSHMLLVVDVAGLNIPANLRYYGKLYLVDLAGSERVKKSGATGQALKEAQNINKSLSALGDVMSALQRKDKFIPYRNSTLTDLMANALGGNAKTIMFVNCCPASAHAFETVSSLKWAQRAGKVELGAATQQKSSSKKKKKDKDT